MAARSTGVERRSRNDAAAVTHLEKYLLSVPADDPNRVPAQELLDLLSAGTGSATTAALGEDGTSSQLVLGPTGLGVAEFGDTPDAVVAATTAVLGPPDVDSGWVPDPFVPGAEERSLGWASLTVVFGDFETAYGPAGTRHFYEFLYLSSPRGLVTAEGTGVDDSVGDLLRTYGGGLDLVLGGLTAAGTYRYQLHPAGTSDFLCLHAGFADEPNDTTPINEITGGGDWPR